MAQWVKNLPANAEDTGLISGLGRSPGEGYGYPLQYSCLESPIDGGAWRAIIQSVAKGQTRLSTHAFNSSLRRTQCNNIYKVLGFC